MHTLTCTIELFHAPSSRNWCTTLTIFSITHTHNAPVDVDFSTTAYSYLMIVTVLECTHRVLLMLLITLIVEIITCPSWFIGVRHSDTALFASTSSFSTVCHYPQSSDRHPRYFSFTSMHHTCLFMHLLGNLADSLVRSHPSLTGDLSLLSTLTHGSSSR